MLGEETSSNRRRNDVDKVIEGLMSSFYGWKIRVDGRDMIFFCVVRFSLVDFIPGPDKHLMSQAGRIFEIKIMQLE